MPESTPTDAELMLTVVRYCRLSVLNYAIRMEERLRANDRKGGWEGDKPASLLARARQELQELTHAVTTGKSPPIGGRSRDEWVWGEAADVGNFAMMVAEVSTTELPPLPQSRWPRGRGR